MLAYVLLDLRERAMAKANGSTVLIVDDDEGIRETLQFALEMRGYTAFTAANGKDGLETLPHIPRPCLILLDLMMPVMDGRDFVRAVEQDQALKGIPIVVVTAFGELLENIDVESVIAKPVPLKLLYETVEEYCCCAPPS